MAPRLRSASRTAPSSSSLGVSDEDQRLGQSLPNMGQSRLGAALRVVWHIAPSVPTLALYHLTAVTTSQVSLALLVAPPRLDEFPLCT